VTLSNVKNQEIMFLFPFYFLNSRLIFRQRLSMSEEEIIKVIIGEAIYVHKAMGPGLLEKVYQNCLAYRLRQTGLFVETEKPVPVFFEGIEMECGYRADLIIERLVVVNTKSLDAIHSLHTAQVLTYLQFLHLRYGLILNFNVELMKNGIKRVLRGY
jgi:GxxExxY protein